MTKPKKKDQHLATAYWSRVGAGAALLLSMQPVFADTIWTRFSTIMKDVYGQPSVSGSIGGEIADRSLGNYMPQMTGHQLNGTSISGGQISTIAVGADGKSAEAAMFSAAQYEAPGGPHSVVTASEGSQWYQMASGTGAGAFYGVPTFSGSASEAGQVAQAFPGAENGTPSLVRPL